LDINNNRSALGSAIFFEKTAPNDKNVRKKVVFWQLGAGIKSIPAPNCQNQGKKRKILSFGAGGEK
jgi:hypothetical protein